MTARGQLPARPVAARSRPGRLPYRWLTVLVVSVVGLSLVGCGRFGGTPDPGPPTGPATSAGPTETPGSGSGPTELTIVVKDGAATVSTWTLTCEPAGGDHPDPAAACGALARNGSSVLPAVPPGRACTQEYGGPSTATVTGTWRGGPISSRFSLVNGCEIARWKALAGLLPPAGTR